jgi:hypothetical protein
VKQGSCKARTRGLGWPGDGETILRPVSGSILNVKDLPQRVRIASPAPAYYHWAPSDARLVWDRLPMTLVLAALLTFLLAERVSPAFATAALWPLASFGAASVLWWSWTRWQGADDLLLYLIVRIGTGVAIAFMLLLRRGRYSGVGWLWTALALDVAMTVAERLDNEIYSATGMLVSGHNAKHLLAGALLGCTLAWLALRRPLSSSSGGHAA